VSIVAASLPWWFDNYQRHPLAPLIRRSFFHLQCSARRIISTREPRLNSPQRIEVCAVNHDWFRYRYLPETPTLQRGETILLATCPVAITTALNFIYNQPPNDDYTGEADWFMSILEPEELVVTQAALFDAYPTRRGG
jgi:hypothetical protein